MFKTFILKTIIIIIGLSLMASPWLLPRKFKSRGKTKHLKAVHVILGLCIIVLSQSFTILPTGYTGVKIRFGQVDPKVVPTGLSFKIPFVDEIKKVNNKLQDLKLDRITVSAETMKQTEITYGNISVTYNINKEKSAWICANVTDYEDNLISPDLVASAIKIASKRFEDTEATDRSKIEPMTAECIQNSLNKKYGSETVLIHKVIIASAEFEESYNKAIVERQNAQMNYEQARIENKRLVEESEAKANAKVKKAEGEAEAKRIAAEADAKATKIQANAQAEANKKLSRSITQELIDMELAKARQEHGWVTVQGAEAIITDKK